MKAKRIDSARIKAFFVAHGEKIAFGFFGLTFVWLCYSAYKTGGYNKTPRELADDAQSTRNLVESRPWNPDEWQVKIPNPPYVKQVEVAMHPVDYKPFVLATLFDVPIRENKVRRDEPKFLAVREVRASFGFGAVRPKKEIPLGKQWVVITGLVPVAEQAAEYQKLFENAWYNNPDLDNPQWLDFQVERAVVKSAGGGNEQWTAIDVHDAISKEFEQFAQERPEVIDRKFQERAVCDPVPPLLGREPDDSMAHPPEIPFALQAKDKENQQKSPEPVADKAVNPLLGGNEQQRRVVVAQSNDGKVAPAETVPYRMFRFFDYTVENDRMYRYRVKVVIKNPNLGVAKRYLKRPELADGERRESPFSEPSPVAIVPPNSRVLAGDVLAPRGLNEARAKVLVIKWEPAKAVEVPHEFDLSRGAFINFPDTETPIPVPGQPDKSDAGKVSFESNTMLVDMMGGEPVTRPNERPIKTPSLMLFMDPFGQLAIHAHVTDFVEFTARRPPTPAKVRKADADKEAEVNDPFGTGDDSKKKPRGRSILDLPVPR
ncbi:MAG TPA: hypothetical protein VG433_01210 [Pirellulales bacterium]|nr:hypothetical protein [Pirellulales bacterium]